MAQKLLLFLVEDSPADVFLVRSAMEEEGLDFVLEVAEDGEDAIGKIARVDRGLDGEVPGLVLIDVNLPRMGGDEVLQRLRQSPVCGSVPVIMFSSSDSRAERQRAFDLGATEYFCKPSSLPDFMKLGKLVRTLFEAAHPRVMRSSAQG